VSKLKIWHFLVIGIEKKKFADALLTGLVSYHSLQNSPLESSCVVVALVENYSTTKPLKVSPEKITDFEL
jgi:hypothetical protein